MSRLLLAGVVAVCFLVASVHARAFEDGPGGDGGDQGGHMDLGSLRQHVRKQTATPRPYAQTLFEPAADPIVGAHTTANVPALVTIINQLAEGNAIEVGFNAVLAQACVYKEHLSGPDNKCKGWKPKSKSKPYGLILQLLDHACHVAHHGSLDYLHHIALDRTIQAFFDHQTPVNARDVQLAMLEYLRATVEYMRKNTGIFVDITKLHVQLGKMQVEQVKNVADYLQEKFPEAHKGSSRDLAKIRIGPVQQVTRLLLHCKTMLKTVNEHLAAIVPESFIQEATKLIAAIDKLVAIVNGAM